MKNIKYVEGKVVEVQFSYSESCKNVYKKISVHINGKKSNIRGLKKYLFDEDDIPGIISANTYFWNPGTNASWRRNNEERRNAEVERWLRNEEFSEDQDLCHLVRGRRRGEKVGIDIENGFYFKKFGEKYHFSSFDDINIELARREVIKRIKREKRVKIINKKINNNKKTLVTRMDSIAAHNCAAGTDNFIKNKVMPYCKKRLPNIKKINALTVETLIAIQDDVYVRRAIAHAIK